MRPVPSILFLAVALSFSAQTMANTIRYALVLGNDVGVDEAGSQPFPPLRHAEREASILKEQLVSLSNFDASAKRTKLLTGASRAAVRAAVLELARQERIDRKTLGNINTLFFFYFTGHGLEGRLLLEDGPLFADEVGGLFQAMDADFSVGVFDACYAGSLDEAGLKAKGMDPVPGLNLFRELPEEVLTAEGNIWYVSSGPKQQSFEDVALGGVFTHYFIEGMKRAPAQGPGITLESVWEYARANTVAYTTERKRPQVPERYIAKLKSSAPFYFSFPVERTATLVLSEGVEGRFLLSYADGQLTEVFEKQRGGERRFAVFPGRATLRMIGEGKETPARPVRLESNSTLVIREGEERAPRIFVGQQSQSLFSKGINLEADVKGTRIDPGLSLLLGGAYGFTVAHELLLKPRHTIMIPLRFDLPKVAFKGALAYGMDQRAFSAFQYSVRQVGGQVSVGYAFDLSIVRLDLSAGAEVSRLVQRYRDGEARKRMETRPYVEAAVLLPRYGRVIGELFVNVGPLYAPGIGKRADTLWSVSGFVGGALYVRIF